MTSNVPLMILSLVMMLVAYYFGMSQAKTIVVSSDVPNDSRIAMCLGKLMGELHITWNYTTQKYDSSCVSPKNGAVWYSFEVSP